MKSALACLVLALGLGVAGLWGQQNNAESAPAPSASVPRLVKFSGAMKDFTGKPLRGPVDINFAIYKEQTDAEPVWQEMQTLQLDEQGRYTVLLGAMQPEGLPMGLFSSGEARWLEVNAAGTELQPRTLLVSVPYALKASDAETLGGKPASAYLLAPVNQTGSGTTQATKGSGTAATGNKTILTAATVTTPSVTYGTANYIPVFTDNSGDMGNSTLYQLGTQVGIATTTPGTLNGHYFPSLLLDAAQATASTYLTADTELQGGYAGVLLNRGAATANNRDWAIENQPDSTLTSSQFAISTYNDAGYPTAMLMISRSGLVGIGTTTPGATLEVNGTGKFDSSLAVAGLTAGNCVQAGAGGLLTTTGSPCGSSSGGGGTITGVTAGTDLTGGGTSGVVTLNLDTTKVPTLGSNTFTGDQTINNGTVHAASTTSSSVVGLTSDYYGAGVLGQNVSTTGYAWGVAGQSASSTGYGVEGTNVATTGNAYGVYGYTNSSTGVGVFGGCPGTSCLAGSFSGNVNVAGELTGSVSTGPAISVTTADPSGLTGSSANSAIFGHATSATSWSNGVFGQADGNGYGVMGFANSTTSTGGAGVYGASLSASAPAGWFDNSRGGPILVGWGTGGKVFRVDTSGKGYFNGGTQTGGADFAESVAVAGDHRRYEAGDVLVIDATGQRRLALAREPYSHRVAGIYSTKPGVLATAHGMDDSAIESEIPLAIVGIVPCKVSAENGAIEAGDLLVTSSTPGHAMKGTKRSRMLGGVLGKALEPLRARTGVIQVLVTLQ